MAWPVDSAVADLERLQRPAIAEPIRDELAEERSFQKPVKDDTRQRDALRVGLVVVDLVEVALRARVLDQLARGRVLDKLRQLLPHFYVHLRIAVPFSRATCSPRWLTYSVSKMMNNRLPVEPGFS